MKWTGPVPRLARTSKQDPCQPRRRRRRGGPLYVGGRAGRGAMRRSGLLNLVPRAQNRCDLRGAGARRRGDDAAPCGRARCRGRGAARDMACRLLGNPYLHREDSSMNAAATQFDTAGWTIAQWQAAYSGARPEACGWPLRRAGRARRQCLDPAGRRSGAGAPAGRTGAAAGGGGRDLSRLPLYGVPLRQHRRRGLADHRLPCVRLHARRGCRRGAAPARRRRHPDRQDQSGPVRHRPGGHAFAARRGGQRVPASPSTSAADRVRARPRWWRADWRCSRWAPTRPARDACRRASTTSSDSSPRAAGSAPPAWCRPAARWTACRCSP